MAPTMTPPLERSSTSARSPLKKLLAAAAASALALGGLALTAAPASAASRDVTTGSPAGKLVWGVASDYRTALPPGANTRVASNGASFDNNDLANFEVNTSGSSWDAGTEIGTINYSGKIRIGYTAGPSGNYFTLENPTVVINGDSGTLSGVTSGKGHNLVPDASEASRTIANLDLSDAVITDNQGNVSITGVKASLTSGGAEVLFSLSGTSSITLRSVGSALDDVQLSFGYQLLPPAATSTAIAVSPASPIEQGTTTTLTATVTPGGEDVTDTPTGKVEFFKIAAGSTDEVSLGEVDLDNEGKATKTVTLDEGGYRFVAEFVENDEWLTSSATTRTNNSSNYGVVDTTPETIASLGSSTGTSTGATATWAYSDYSTDWTKTATGNISVAEDGETFTFTNGTVTADDANAKITFTGTFKLSAYDSFGGAWIEFTDPVLTISQEGKGVWSADVRSKSDVNFGPMTPSEEVSGTDVVFATFSSATGIPAVGESGTTTVTFDYADRVEPGAWAQKDTPLNLAPTGYVAAATTSTGYTGAWPSAFTYTYVPKDIRAFYYDSGASADAKKVADPATFTFAWPEVVEDDGDGSGDEGSDDQGSDDEGSGDEGTDDGSDDVSDESTDEASDDTLAETGWNDGGAIAAALAMLLLGAFVTARSMRAPREER